MVNDPRFDLEHIEHAFHMDSTCTVAATMTIATDTAKTQIKKLLSKVVHKKIPIYIIDDSFILRAPKARKARQRTAAAAPVKRTATQNIAARVGAILTPAIVKPKRTILE